MSEHDPIRPSHYNDFTIKPIDAIRDWGLNFNLGNAVKYITRAGKKDPSKLIEDLRKSEAYLQHEIASLLIPVDDDDQETVFDALTRISKSTGFSENKVLETALNLYEDAIDAAMRDDDESKAFSASRCANCGMPIVFEPCVKAYTGLSDGSTVDIHVKCLKFWHGPMKLEPEKPKFAVGDKVVLANIETACVGVIKGVQVNDDKETAYEVAWTAQTGDARFESELKPFEVEPEKPKFKPGDRVGMISEDSANLGIVHSSYKQVDGSGRHTRYIVRWQIDGSSTPKCTGDHAELSLEPYSPRAKKFAVGDKVQYEDRDGVAVVYDNYYNDEGEKCLSVVWTPSGCHGTILAKEAVLAND